MYTDTAVYNNFRLGQALGPGLTTSTETWNGRTPENQEYLSPEYLNAERREIKTRNTKIRSTSEALTPDYLNPELT